MGALREFAKLADCLFSFGFNTGSICFPLGLLVCVLIGIFMIISGINGLADAKTSEYTATTCTMVSATDHKTAKCDSCSPHEKQCKRQCTWTCKYVMESDETGSRQFTIIGKANPSSCTEFSCASDEHCMEECSRHGCVGAESMKKDACQAKCKGLQKQCYAKGRRGTVEELTFDSQGEDTKKFTLILIPACINVCVSCFCLVWGFKMWIFGQLGGDRPADDNTMTDGVDKGIGRDRLSHTDDQVHHQGEYVHQGALKWKRSGQLRYFVLYADSLDCHTCKEDAAKGDNPRSRLHLRDVTSIEAVTSEDGSRGLAFKLEGFQTVELLSISQGVDISDWLAALATVVGAGVVEVDPAEDAKQIDRGDSDVFGDDTSHVTKAKANDPLHKHGKRLKKRSSKSLTKPSSGEIAPSELGVRLILSETSEDSPPDDLRRATSLVSTDELFDVGDSGFKNPIAATQDQEAHGHTQLLEDGFQSKKLWQSAECVD